MEGGIAVAFIKKLPVGVDGFETLIRQGYYYLDKTAFIKDFINWHGLVNLFTRPRRFGKTLNMSMLKAFFEVEADYSLFEGLEIEKDRAICDAYQGKFPVIFLSLKGVSGNSFQEAFDMLAMVVANECKRLSYLMRCDRIEPADRDIVERLAYRKGDLTDLKVSLATLMRVLHIYHNQQVILLIDEYDVPLDKAKENGYYLEMINLLRNFLGEAFKTNNDLYFAILTGCLRISKESIFTGVNNLKVDTISDVRYDEYFGFTDNDVHRLLTDYDLIAAYDNIKDWYDGYLFGNREVYCPWDVLNHCDKLLANPTAEPEAYWDNSSSNQLVRHFIDLADDTDRENIERLIRGEELEKKLVMNLTYDELGKKELLWSVLYQTGYLTLARSSSARQRGYVRFVIPNREIQELFIEKIREWFSEKVAGSQKTLSELYTAFEQGDRAAVETFLNEQLRAAISYYDSYESFYHGFLLGLLKGKADWSVLSNREMGEGRSDIQVKARDGKTGIIIEVKHAKNRQTQVTISQAALRQIEEKGYADALYDDGFSQIWAYGIAFYKKSCRVSLAQIGE